MKEPVSRATYLLELEGEKVEGSAKQVPPEISAHILRALKEAGEKSLDEPVRQAVINVPAYFNDAQRQATQDAGRIAGLGRF